MHNGFLPWRCDAANTDQVQKNVMFYSLLVSIAFMSLACCKTDCSCFESSPLACMILLSFVVIITSRLFLALMKATKTAAN